ncbi:CorA family divalent cation transporter [Ferrovibrio sp.]|uniref:CorA family divalent cation transporter n=1 Tax=Ferrovibrio sp. TaxID=1917215 RepID=UPI0025C343C9|nr:CorA family divalent cation transporter [Ferrovibrio sp.]MBX3453979.1 zinc transporter ZntB [Ferrovibrio sp.]
MDQQRGLIYGQQQGLRFALLLDGSGGAREIGWDGIRAWHPAQGVLWVHLERDDEYAARWLRDESGLDAVLCDALLAEESRPRVQETNGGLQVVMRGVNRDPDNNVLDLVPIHIWGNEQRLISLRDKDHYLHALRDIRESLATRRGPVRAGHLFTKIARKVIKGIEPVLDQLEDEVDDLDHEIEQCDVKESRSTLSLLRRRAISLRRYMAPQREALFRMQGADVEWLKPRDRQRMRDLTDKVLRSVETLDALRDRTTILHEDLTTLVTEQIAQTSNRLTALAAVLLPPSLVAGLLGANVAGIPGHDTPWAFAVICGITAFMLVAEVWLLRKLKWF